MYGVIAHATKFIKCTKLAKSLSSQMPRHIKSKYRAKFTGMLKRYGKMIRMNRCVLIQQNK